MHVFNNRPNIKDLFEFLNAEHFNGEVPDVPVVWNTRMTTTAGYCRYKKIKKFGGRGAVVSIEPTKIDLSDKLFRNLGYDLGKIEETLVHEMVHAYLIHKYNEGGHTARFQRMMTDITGEHKNHRCHNYETNGLRRRQKRNIAVNCPTCGVIGYRARMPKRGARYLCNKCRDVVNFTREG